MTASRIERLARKGLGIERLRPEQREAVEAAIAGHDVLAVMPTGYGKSAIYQLVAASVDGPTVVVSPLIALQRDQVDRLDDDDVGEAVAANSTMTASERRQAFEGLRDGEVEFLFVAPEQLASDDTMEAIRAAKPSVFVVDEAHCISSWGHDFRPDYLRLGHVIDQLGHPIVIALTATAAPPVRDEIAERLHLRNPRVIVKDFDRPNIRLSVEHPVEGAEKDRLLVERATALGEGRRAGIVYVATRQRTEDLSAALAERGVRAAGYHGGLPKRRRDEVHQQFMAGDLDVVVATTAFGLGVDKADVRFVLHGDVPESLDSYYQEIGRGGRDGDAAEAVLFYRAADLGLRRFLGAGGGVRREDVEQVLAVLDDSGGTATVDDIHDAADLSRRRLTLALARLEDGRVVDLDGDEVSANGGDPDAAAESVVAGEEQRKQVEASRLEMMRGYAETTTCRRRFLLSYFGEEYDRDCGACDNCESGAASRSSADDEAAPYPSGATVEHVEWGTGRVIRVDGDTVTVLFDDVGYKTLSARLSAEGDLLNVVG